MTPSGRAVTKASQSRPEANLSVSPPLTGSAGSPASFSGPHRGRAVTSEVRENCSLGGGDQTLLFSPLAPPPPKGTKALRRITEKKCAMEDDDPQIIAQIKPHGNAQRLFLKGCRMSHLWNAPNPVFAIRSGAWACERAVVHRADAKYQS